MMYRSDGGPHRRWDERSHGPPGQGFKQALERARAEQSDRQRRRRRRPQYSRVRSGLSAAIVVLIMGTGLLFQASQPGIDDCTARVLRGEMTVEDGAAQTLYEGAALAINDGAGLRLRDSANVLLTYGCFRVVLGPDSHAQIASRDFIRRSRSFRLETDFQGLAGMTTLSAQGSGAYLRLNTPASIVTLRCDEPWLAAVYASEGRTVVAVAQGAALVEPVDSPWLARRAREGQVIVATETTLRVTHREPPSTLGSVIEATEQQARGSWSAYYAQLIATQVASVLDAIGL